MRPTRSKMNRPEMRPRNGPAASPPLPFDVGRWLFDVLPPPHPRSPSPRGRPSSPPLPFDVGCWTLAVRRSAASAPPFAIAPRPPHPHRLYPSTLEVGRWLFDVLPPAAQRASSRWHQRDFRRPASSHVAQIECFAVAMQHLSAEGSEVGCGRTAGSSPKIMPWASCRASSSTA